VSDASEPLATANPTATRPRVVVIVRPHAERVPAVDPSEETVGIPAPARNAQDTVSVGVPAPSSHLVDSANEETNVLEPGAVRAAIGAKSLIPPEDVPTERFVLDKSKKPRQRTAEDDRLVAAVIQLDLNAEVSPLSPFLGASLLERAGRAAERAGAPRLVLVSASRDKERLDSAIQAAQRGFRGPVELLSEDPSEESFGRGRLLLLDGSALHDGPSLARLARMKGPNTGLLLGQHGDGLRIRTAEGKVIEVGPDVQPNDGALIGAASCPVEDFAMISRRGLRSVLDRLSREEQLLGLVAHDAVGRQFRDDKRRRQAQKHCYDALAESRGEGLLDQWIGRPIARALTLALLPRDGISPTHVLLLATLFGLVAAILLAVGHRAAAAVAGLFLVISAVLDRCDGELARLRLDDRPRPLDFVMDHVILLLVFLGLAWGIHSAPEGVAGWDKTMALLPEQLRAALSGKLSLTALRVGLAGSLGAMLMLAVSAWRGPPRPDSRGIEWLGDLVAESFGSRDYGYVLLVGGIVHAIFPQIGLLGLLLLGCVALIHGFWVLLLLAQLISPRKREDV